MFLFIIIKKYINKDKKILLFLILDINRLPSTAKISLFQYQFE
jgi:hypothetical protein